MKLSVIATSALLFAVGKAAEAIFYDGEDCGGSQIGDPLTVPDESGNVAERDFEEDHQPVSIKVTGWHVLSFTRYSDNQFDPACAFCANYYTTDGHMNGDCAADDQERCITLNMAWGPAHAKLIAVGDPSPADLPCRNYQIDCDFPVPPGNGWCDQGQRG